MNNQNPRRLGTWRVTIPGQVVFTACKQVEKREEEGRPTGGVGLVQIGAQAAKAAPLGILCAACPELGHFPQPAVPPTNMLSVCLQWVL